MSSILSAETVTSPTDRAIGGRFAKGNPGGPGNPFARQTAALRAYLINHVTERDIQDILDILLLNAKGGHLPTIKFLFAYVIGKPQPAVNPDVLDLQELQLFQQGALPPEALETLARQLPLPFLLQLVNHSQAVNQAETIREADDDRAAEQPSSGSKEPEPVAEPCGEQAAPTPAPSTNRFHGSERSPATASAPSANGNNGGPQKAPQEKRRSTNGEKRPRPPRTGFDWLRDLRRLLT
jgi:hypothetical protein